MTHVYKFPLDYVLAHFCDPFTREQWGLGVISREAVSTALIEGRFDARPNAVAWGPDRCWPCDDPHHRGPFDQTYDIERIAYLVQHRDRTPIVIHVWENAERYHFVDGAHRTSAAAYCEDAEILVRFTGCADSFEKLFGHVCRPCVQEGDDALV